jgi:hypothetical protein
MYASGYLKVYTTTRQLDFQSDAAADLNRSVGAGSSPPSENGSLNLHEHGSPMIYLTESDAHAAP